MRTIHNVTYDQALISPRQFYRAIMPVVGGYNQKTNKGSIYNAGWPFYGERTYSGTGIISGYFGKKP